MRSVLHVTIHPRAVELRRAHHLNTRLQDVLQGTDGDHATLLRRLLGENAADALQRPRAFETNDMKANPAESARQRHRKRIGNHIHQCAEEAQQEVFKIDAESGLRHHATPCPPLTYTWPSSNATFST